MRVEVFFFNFGKIQVYTLDVILNIYIYIYLFQSEWLKIVSDGFKLWLRLPHGLLGLLSFIVRSNVWP